MAFPLAFMIELGAGAFWWKSTLLIADAISRSILLESGTLLSVPHIRHLSAMVDPAIRAPPGTGPRTGPTGTL